jgi:acyl-CoA thioester hydrolase
LSRERKAPSERSDYAGFRQLTTRWMDNDVYGHMNNVVHYSLFDTAVNAWLAEAGQLDFIAGSRVGLVVETGCRYFGEMMFPDIIHAGLKVTHVGTSSVRYEIGLFRNDENRASAEGFFVHVYVDRESRRPLPLDDGFRAALERLAK